MTIGNMPIGGAQPPNAVIGGIMAAISYRYDLRPTRQSALPFRSLCLVGSALSSVFTLMSPLMSTADNMAHNEDIKGIERLNYFAIGSARPGLRCRRHPVLHRWRYHRSDHCFRHPDLAAERSVAAGGMMRFVGFAVLLKVMMNRDMWGFFLMGFGLALLTVANESLATPALLILALIGFGIAFWDFQQQTELKGAAVSDGGDFEDGI